MKNVRFGLFILASACLIFMLAPCALAQEGGDDGCCFNVPSNIPSLNISILPLLYSAPVSQLSVPAEMPVPDQMLIGMPLLADARKLNYVR
jgi:hypothetical protein